MKKIKWKKIKCCICGKEIEEWESNTAFPVSDGYCCNECNMNVVIPKRFGLTLMGLN